MSPQKYFTFYSLLIIKGIGVVFLYVIKAAVGILIIYGGYFMIKSFFKWLGKNHEWFELAEKRLEALEKDLEAKGNVIHSLKSELSKTKGDRNLFIKEITKLREFTGLSELEKIEDATKVVEEEVTPLKPAVSPEDYQF